MRMISSFKELNLKAGIASALEKIGFEKPTEIQAQAIPLVLEGNDVLGQAQTGTGKTAAFALPMLNRLDENSKNIQALILCPTRELALQVTEETKKFAQNLRDVKIVPVFGGQSYEIQKRAIKKNPQVIVGTPGRIIDLMERRIISFKNISTLILDEADEMLKMGFKDDMEYILKSTPKDRQTLLFSATMPKAIQDIATNYQKDAMVIKVKNKALTVDRIKQEYFTIKADDKTDLLIRLLDFYNLKSSIVFCNTKREVDELVLRLQKHDYMTEGLHGDLKQEMRNRVMNSFKNGSVQVLVATDVAARGIDVTGIEAVFNYDIPLDEESYVHRIGRTGRAGNEGLSFTFITRRQFGKLRDIERYTKQELLIGKIPTVEDIEKVRIRKVVESAKSAIDNEFAHQKLYDQIITELIEQGYDMKQITNSFLNVIIDSDHRAYKEIKLDTGMGNNRNSRDSRDSRNSRDRRSGDNRNNNRRREQSVQIYVDLGKNQRVSPKELVTALTKNSSIPRRAFGDININKTYTTVDVSKRDVDAIIKNSRGKKYRGFDMHVKRVEGKN